MRSIKLSRSIGADPALVIGAVIPEDKLEKGLAESWVSRGLGSWHDPAANVVATPPEKVAVAPLPEKPSPPATRVLSGMPSSATKPPLIVKK